MRLHACSPTPAHDRHEARTGSAHGVLTAAHAKALVAAGESRRALAALTPLPPGAEVEATVAMAVGRQAIGRRQGAGAVLSSVVDGLEQAPLGLQIRSWILEARIADQQGHPTRSHSLVERALQAASPDGLRAPLLWDWSWLRTLRRTSNPVLLHTYRGVLTGLHEATAIRPPRSEPTLTPPGAPADAVAVALTEREVQVLELPRQMCSTDEIARALYVSANTVKTHVKGIFAKLCVNRRVDAVRRGRQLLL
ncbi:LuxR C-terminal-related transcriptional regulator [Aeromicrobium sp. UC242_57]|uniref:response regulator transcription factor n=1 Tax=Aeromicrobium sp. UC242_57 TaxID=3374624 RepID=UPI0037B91B78